MRESSWTLLRQLHELNEAHGTELSHLNEACFKSLIDAAFCAIALADGAGFLFAFDQDANYDSSNFAWFRQRFDRFVYIDRVAIDPKSRGQGLARELYRHVEAVAAASEHQLLTCEVNLRPPNSASDKFHARLGFRELGSASLPSGKVVRYLAKQLR